MRRLEAEVGVRLLQRTTRSVAPTEAGARLLERLGPALAEIASALDVVLKVDPKGPLVANLGNASDLLVAAAIAGTGILYLFEDWLQPHFESGA